MFFAERQRKLGRDGSLAHDRAEDLLTSTVFQLLRYIPAQVGLLATLARARRVVRSNGVFAVERASSWPTLLQAATDYRVRLWPWRDKHGEPDAVVTLVGPDGVIGNVLIEAKLFSGKSSEADTDAPPVESDEAARPGPTAKVLAAFACRTSGRDRSHLPHESQHPAA